MAIFTHIMLYTWLQGHVPMEGRPRDVGTARSRMYTWLQGHVPMEGAARPVPICGYHLVYMAARPCTHGRTRVRSCCSATRCVYMAARPCTHGRSSTVCCGNILARYTWLQGHVPMEGDQCCITVDMRENASYTWLQGHVPMEGMHSLLTVHR